MRKAKISKKASKAVVFNVCGPSPYSRHGLEF